VSLSEKTCVPCRGGVPPLTAREIEPLAAQLQGWTVDHDHHIEKRFPFPNFKTALKLVEEVGAIAEEQGHHPDICFGWGYVSVKIWTHKIDGLTESDFILAAKIDRLGS
jgi:4a-hydroxytetrahydrobiopterin dehydratase